VEKGRRLFLIGGMMKKLMLGGAAVVALAASSALAADLGPTPAPSDKTPAIAPQYDWTGSCLGAHAPL